LNKCFGAFGFAYRVNCFYLDAAMKLTEDQKLRILIVVTLLAGWILVVFFRSGTSWG